MKGHCEVKAREKAKKQNLKSFEKLFKVRETTKFHVYRERERGDIIKSIEKKAREVD